MGQKLVIGPINKGLRNDREAFIIDNDSFPTLINAYQWRGRVKRKRGTSYLGRLNRFLDTTDGAGNLNFTIEPIPITSGISSFTVGDVIFVDPGGASPVNLLTAGPGTATLNRATGLLSIVGSSANADVYYYPTLPVMGLKDFNVNSNQYPGTIAFDTKKSYNISQLEPYPIWDVSFYKNPPIDADNLPGYTPKVTPAATSWNGQDYQQFWTTNYQGAMWATNGITIPFTTTNIGMQYSGITNVTPFTLGNGTTIPAVVDITVTGPNLIVGDFVFLNEFDSTIITGINFQTGYITTGSSPGVIRVTLPFAILAGAGGATTQGIVQYLTNRADESLDCIRWYDGDPTANGGKDPVASNSKGWVNFCPPLSQGDYSISDLPAAQYYLVGARMIVPFKDRLLFFGPVVQTSAAGSQVYLQDTVIYSQNGTPYYTASFNGDASLSTTVFYSVLTPLVGGVTPLINQTATAPSWWEDQTGFGGFLAAGIDQPIITVAPNEDVLIIGLTTIQTRLVYSGNDVSPFYFYLINSELGSGSTFSSIVMDKSVFTRGSRGYIATSQVEAARIDLPIPDQVFQIRTLENGNERFTAQRDYINEWIYFSYPNDTIDYKFPNQTLQYNYRDDSWSIFNETYTTYGLFRQQTGFIWTTVGGTFPSWAEWNEPWNAGSSSLLKPKVIAGNQQGFVVFRDEGAAESNSLYIQNFSSSVVTSPNHTLNTGDFISISGVLGTIGEQVNGKTFFISNTTTNTFTLNPTISSGTYLGGGLIKRMYRPYIQTKQFPASWEMAKKTRIGVQRYLLTKTDNGQMQLLIFLSQDNANPYNDGPLIPEANVQNDSLIYSTVLYTCPESTNLGLTPANTNLQQLTLVAGTTSANNQQQIWHRVNTSLIGDTIQLGFTISNDQMLMMTDTEPLYDITGIVLGTTTVLSTTAQVSAGKLVKINDVEGTTELNYDTNGNILYNVISSTPTTVTIEVDSSLYTPYIDGGTVNQVYNYNQFAEIELHGIIIDISPSMELI